MSVNDAGFQHHGQRSSSLRQEQGWRSRQVLVVVLVLLLVGVSLADFRRGCTQSFLHGCTPPTTSSVPDFHTENSVCACEIAAFMKYWSTQHHTGWSREERGGDEEKRGRGGVGYSFGQQFIMHPPYQHHQYPPSFYIPNPWIGFDLLSDHDHIHDLSHDKAKTPTQISGVKKKNTRPAATSFNNHLPTRLPHIQTQNVSNIDRRETRRLPDVFKKMSGGFTRVFSQIRIDPTLDVMQTSVTVIH